MAGRMLLVDEPGGTPYKEHRVGRVYIYEQESTLLVFLYRAVLYTHTNDMVYSEQAGRHVFSSWPLLYDALSILRFEMVLDDLGST